MRRDDVAALHSSSTEIESMTDYGAAELANGFRTVRRNTILVANDIPESSYDFVPAPGARSASELLRHIAFASTFYEDIHRVRAITTLQGYDFGAISQAAVSKERQPRDKAATIAVLESEGERIATWLESLSDDFLNETFTDPMGQNPKTRLENLMSIKEHEMHHRGQLMLIQRMVGVVPHLTRQREERQRARDRATAGAGA
jgi:uncharacterized damage-inducible protein DinB